jgi:integrase
MPGVIKKDQHIQIDLRTVGYGKERLDLLPTPVNLRYAENLRNEILGKIERGTFALADYFPDSPRVKKDAPSMTMGELFTEWLRVKAPDVQHSTAHHYRQTLESYHFDGVRNTRAPAFGFRQLRTLLAQLPEHPKTFNNVASGLRMVLEYGYRAKILKEPLHEEIHMRRHQKPGPDPFTLDQVEHFLSKFQSECARDYYEFAFFSGLRPSEQIALQWSKIDLRAGSMRVDEALTRGKLKGTKTSVARDVELTQRALAALERQRARTQVAGGRIFVDEDGQPFATTDGPLRNWWKPTMRRSGLRARDARQSRHTFATVCLMAGITPAWVARQLGHSVEMFYRVYSRWIDGADKGAERRKLDAFLGDNPPMKNGTRTGTSHKI